MRLIRLAEVSTDPITQFESVGASSRRLATGQGEARVHWLDIEPGGSIGEHRAGYGQLLFVVEGSGWVAGSDGHRADIGAGEIAYFERGELHSKGSERGMKALMIQVADVEPSTPQGTT